MPRSDPLATARSWRSLPAWLGAALGAVLLHGAVAAAFLAAAPPPETSDDDAGAPAIAIGIELASQRQEAADLPPGPESEASAAATASIQREAEPEQVPDVPLETPLETEEPDRVVATERVERPPTPTELTPLPTPERSQASAESVASEARAAPSLDAPREAPVTTAPVQGTGESAARVKATWQRQLVGHLNRNKRYPPGGARRDAEILVSFTMDRTGRLVSAEVTRGSGDAAFDSAALAMLRRADPLPVPPPAVADDGLTFSLPVIFKATGRT